MSLKHFFRKTMNNFALRDTGFSYEQIEAAADFCAGKIQECKDVEIQNLNKNIQDMSQAELGLDLQIFFIYAALGNRKPVTVQKIGCGAYYKKEIKPILLQESVSSQSISINLDLTILGGENIGVSLTETGAVVMSALEGENLKNTLLFQDDREDALPYLSASDFDEQAEDVIIREILACQRDTDISGLFSIPNTELRLLSPEFLTADLKEDAFAAVFDRRVQDQSDVERFCANSTDLIVEQVNLCKGAEERKLKQSFAQPPIGSVPPQRYGYEMQGNPVYHVIVNDTAPTVINKAPQDMIYGTGHKVIRKGQMFRLREGEICALPETLTYIKPKDYKPYTPSGTLFTDWDYNAPTAMDLIKSEQSERLARDVPVQEPTTPKPKTDKQKNLRSYLYRR